MHQSIFNKKFSHKAKNQNTGKPTSFALFKLPYLGSISHQIEKELHQYFKTQIPDVKLRIVHLTNKLKQQFYKKDSQRLLFCSNIVYKLKCSCGSVYIGETCRNLIKCLEKHQASPNSEVCNHLQSNLSHTVDFLNPKILAYSPDKYKLLILESLYIQQLKSDLNLDSTSFPLCLFNM